MALKTCALKLYLKFKVDPSSMRARTGCSDSWNIHQGLLVNSRSTVDFYRTRFKYDSVLCMKVLAEPELLSLFYMFSKNLSASVSLQNNLMGFIC